MTEKDNDLMYFTVLWLWDIEEDKRYLKSESGVKWKL